jgi:hypothetical protein
MTLSAETTLPEVQISPRVIERMKLGALRFLDSETGEALVGVRLPAERRAGFPTMIVLETIPPIQNAVRQWAMFSQGDDWQAAIFNWLHENWEVYRDLRRRSYGKATSAKWDLPLLHLGDWHKQPGMVAPSSMDYHTAQEFMADSGLSHLLTPIVTLAEETTAPLLANTLVYEDVSPSVRLDWWGIAHKGRDFIPLKPIVTLGYGLPRLPEVVWWIDDSQRLDLEIAALEKDGLSVLDVVQHNADGMPPLETCLVIYRPGADHVILAVTPHTYPKKAPEWRSAPLMRPNQQGDWFEALFAASQALPAQATRGWQGHHHALIDGVHMLEAHWKGQAL